MNKEDIINEVAKTTCSKVEAGKAVNAFLDAIKKSLKKENKVTLVGFGTFSVSKRSAKTGRNPQTGQEIKIAARKVPKFTAGKALRDSVNMIDKINKEKITFKFYSPEAQSVFLAGCFNEWNPAANPLEKNKEGNWSTVVNLVPGRYEYRFIADGLWKDDPTCMMRNLNQYGGYNCLLNVD
jgi:nucleoid DNA-binding protein